MALGARPAEVQLFVLRQGLALAGAGTLLGLAAALVASRLLSKLLYEVAPGRSNYARGVCGSAFVGCRCCVLVAILSSGPNRSHSRAAAGVVTSRRTRGSASEPRAQQASFRR